MSSDISHTEHEGAGAARNESEEQIRLPGEVTHDLIWSWDLLAGKTFQSAGYEETFGPAPASPDALYEWWRQRVHPADVERVLAAFNRTVADGGSAVSYAIPHAGSLGRVSDDRRSRAVVSR